MESTIDKAIEILRRKEFDSVNYDELTSLYDSAPSDEVGQIIEAFIAAAPDLSFLEEDGPYQLQRGMAPVRGRVRGIRGKKKCKAKPCGNTCIATNKVCHDGLSPEQIVLAKKAQAAMKSGGAAVSSPLPEPKKTEPKKTEPKKTEPKKTAPKSVEPKKTEPKSALSEAKGGPQYDREGKEIFTRENGRRIALATPRGSDKYNNPEDLVRNISDKEVFSDERLDAMYKIRPLAVDPNLSLSLPSHGDPGNTMKPSEAKKVYQEFIKKRGAEGEPVVMVVRGKEDLDIARSLGLVPATHTADYSSSETGFDFKLRKLEAPTAADLEEGMHIFVGKKQGDKVVSFTEEEIRQRAEVQNNRALQVGRLQTLNEWRNSWNGLDFDDDPPSEAAVKAFHKNEDKILRKTEALEDSMLGRKPGKVGSFADYEAKAEAWATKTFGGPTTEGANGFTLQQTKKHDVAHPVTHELTGLDSDGINQRFGSLTQKDGKKSLIAEEAVVNITEHLSRGDTIDGAILNGIRLARTLSRQGTEEERKYVRSREFKNELVKIGHEIYKSDNFSPLIQYVRQSNRESGTVHTGGNDFTNSATGG